MLRTRMMIPAVLLTAAALTHLATADVVASWGGNYLSVNNSTAVFVGTPAPLTNIDRGGTPGGNDNGFGLVFSSPSGSSIAPTTLGYPTSGSGYVAGPAVLRRV